jgi:uncharacterized protein (DUF983 family)
LDVDSAPGALWRQAVIDDLRLPYHPELTRIVVAIDPSGSSKAVADECGIVVAGVGRNGHGYVIADLSKRDTPRGWAQTAVAAFHSYRADRIIAEQNFGGEMVELTLRTVDPNISYKAVNASRGKAVRAEPVSALYEKRMVHHVGSFELLEEELTSWVPGDPSPNRLDALVWCLSELMVGNETYGLLEFLASPIRAVREKLLEYETEFRKGYEQAQAKVDAAVRQPVFPGAQPAKPVAEAPKPTCPKCGSEALWSSRALTKCGDCGHVYVPASIERVLQTRTWAPRLPVPEGICPQCGGNTVEVYSRVMRRCAKCTLVWRPAPQMEAFPDRRSLI